MKMYIVLAVSLFSMNAFSAEWTGTVETLKNNGTINFNGNTHGRFSGCVGATLVPASDEVEAEMAKVTGGEQVKVTGSQLSRRECTFLIRKFEIVK